MLRSVVVLIVAGCGGRVQGLKSSQTHFCRVPLNTVVQLLLPAQEVLKDMIIADREIPKTVTPDLPWRLTLFPADQVLATVSGHVLG